MQRKLEGRAQQPAVLALAFLPHHKSAGMGRDLVRSPDRSPSGSKAQRESSILHPKLTSATTSSSLTLGSPTTDATEQRWVFPEAEQL